MVVNGFAPQGGDDTTAALPTDVETEVVDLEASQEVMSLLSEHVPLALLADLAIPEGPASPDILTEEGLPEVAWWEGGEEDEPVRHHAERSAD
jgi:hypothetical protein